MEKKKAQMAVAGEKIPALSDEKLLEEVINTATWLGKIRMEIWHGGAVPTKKEIQKSLDNLELERKELLRRLQAGKTAIEKLKGMASTSSE